MDGVRLTLCVDALSAQPGGIGRYNWELCKGLAGHSGISEIRYYGRGRWISDPSSLLRDEALVGERGGKLRKLARGWQEARWLASSVVHGPNYFLPKVAKTGVITVHDLSVFRFPETHPVDRVRAFEKGFTDSLNRASHIITDTQTVRAELIDRYDLPPDRVTAIWLGVARDIRPMPVDDLVPTLMQWKIAPTAYALCVSTLEPRKKIGELLNAWRRLPRDLRDAYPLVLAGGAGWRNEALLEQIAVGVAEGWLKHLGFVAEADLPALYSGAALFLYPSIYEGFGLPPLEAMACGAPVMVSSSSCLPEVCGEAARYIDPDDPDGFVQSIEANLTDHAWRAGAALRGTAHAAGFDWATCIDRTVDVYRQVAAG